MKMMYQPSQNNQNHPDNDASEWWSWDGKANCELFRFNYHSARAFNWPITTLITVEGYCTVIKSPTDRRNTKSIRWFVSIEWISFDKAVAMNCAVRAIKASSSNATPIKDFLGVQFRCRARREMCKVIAGASGRLSRGKSPEFLARYQRPFDTINRWHQECSLLQPQTHDYSTMSEHVR